MSLAGYDKQALSLRGCSTSNTLWKTWIECNLIERLALQLGSDSWAREGPRVVSTHELCLTCWLWNFLITLQERALVRHSDVLSWRNSLLDCELPIFADVFIWSERTACWLRPFTLWKLKWVLQDPFSGSVEWQYSGNVFHQIYPKKNKSLFAQHVTPSALTAHTKCFIQVV